MDAVDLVYNQIGAGYLPILDRTCKAVTLDKITIIEGGNQNKLNFVTGELSRIADSISETTGQKLFNAVLSHISHFGAHILPALKLISNWLVLSDDSHKKNFSNQIYSQFQNNPKEQISILSACWEYLPKEEIKRHIIQFYSVEPDSEIINDRNETVGKAINCIDRSLRVEVIMEIWSILIKANQNGESFIKTAINFIELAELIELREKAINGIRSNGAADSQSEVQLRFLSRAVREDMREIMPSVDLFVNLFGRGEDDIQLATKYVVPVLKPLGIRNDHKHKLASAMGKAAQRSSEELNKEIHVKADQLGLMWFSYRKHWK